jgi:hypothetical protein
VNANLKLYAAVTGRHVPKAAFDALGAADQSARALAVAGHKALAFRAAEQAGLKVNLNGWRVASPPPVGVRQPNNDVLALLKSKILFSPKPGTVLLSRPSAIGFVARWHHGVQRWVRVAEFVDDQAVLLPGAVDELRWDSHSRQWQIDSGAWRARRYFGGESYGGWFSLDNVLLCQQFPRRLS